MYKTNTLVFILAMLFGTSIQAQIFVSQLAVDGNNDGTSWNDAYLDLTDGLQAANEGDEIWIALGEYFPPAVMIDDGEEIDTTHAYIIDKNIKIYGGFIGVETSIDQRNPTFNPVILNGDINNDDINSRFDTLKNDNARHVLYVTDNITNATIIDGLFIWRGFAASSQQFASEYGGGIYSEGYPIIRNCTVNQCGAAYGGGIAIVSGQDSLGNGTGSLLIDKCDIDRNVGGFGSGIFASDLQTIDILNTKVSRNTLAAEGTIYIDNADSTRLLGASIRENEAELFSVFYGNEIKYCSFDDCIVNENKSASGTIYFEEGEFAEFNSTKVVNNTADSLSAGIASEESEMLFVNCDVSGNTTTLKPPTFGQVGSPSEITLIHTTVAGTQSPVILMEDLITLQNSIVSSEEDGAFVSSANILSNGGNLCSDASMDAGLTQSTDLKSTDPLFKDIAGGDFSLRGMSPAVGAAVPSTITVDVDGVTRDMDPDIGAYEFVVSATTQTQIPGLTVKLLPTVTLDNTTVEWEGVDAQEMEYSIVDLQGRVLQTGFINHPNQQLKTFDLVNGQYQIIFRTNTGVTARSFIKL